MKKKPEAKELLYKSVNENSCIVLNRKTFENLLKERLGKIIFKRDVNNKDIVKEKSNTKRLTFSTSYS